MNSISPVAAIPANLLDQALRDPRVIEAAMRAGVSLKSPAELAALLTGASQAPVRPTPAPEPENILHHPGASLFDTVRSRRPADAIRAYKTVEAVIR